MYKWENVEYDEALHLLSTFFSANGYYTKNTNRSAMIKVREYATSIIQETDTKTFSLILLQLVQALRYE